MTELKKTTPKKKTKKKTKNKNSEINKYKEESTLSDRTLQYIRLHITF